MEDWNNLQKWNRSDSNTSLLCIMVTVANGRNKSNYVEEISKNHGVSKWSWSQGIQIQNNFFEQVLSEKFFLN